MKTRTAIHENFQIVFNSETYNGEVMDTEVKILPAYDNNNIMVIAGNDIDNFTKEFAQLINKYRI